MTIKKILFAALLSVFSQVLMAQGVVSGTLSDNEGPIMMGTICEIDANNRIVTNATTDFNGNFSMKIKSTKNKLRFSYVGDKTQTVPIGNQTVFKIKLQPANTQLKEVTVKGRRSSSGGLMIQKKEVSVSQQSMNMENIEGLAFTSADEALQGEIAGLDIVANSGNLGAGTTMRLRGVSSISGNANPLIVVDDKVFDNPDEDFDFQNANEEQYASLLSVNVDDIASITVLKDAAATAVWGSQGANGVLLITTKHGTRGKPRVNFSYKFTGTWMPDGYTLLDGDSYSMMMKESLYNQYQRANATTNINELNYLGSDRWAEAQNWDNNTDWVDAVTQFGGQHEYNLNLSGGGEKATFRISAGYKHQTGTVIKQKFQQFTTRLVLDYNVSDRIRFSTNFALTYTGNDKNYGNNLLSIAQKMAPNMSIYRQNPDGSNTDEYYIMNPTNPTTDAGATDTYSSNQLSAIESLGNPVAIANMAWAKENTYRLTPDFSIRYELLGTEAESHRLTLNGRVDFDIYANSSPSYAPAALYSRKWSATTYNLSTNTESNRMKIGGRVELQFTPYFKNEDWSATMLARYEMSTSKYNKQYVAMNGLPTGILDPTVDAWLRGDGDLSSENSRSASQYLLYNGHVSYKDGRYSLGFSLRADGNSTFGPDHKWMIYPGVSLRYNISDEPFFTPLKGDWLSIFGLRASWGRTGGTSASTLSFYNSYNTSAGFYGGSSSTLPTGSMSGLKLDDLRPERKTEWNLGLNAGFFADKLEVDFNYYFNEIDDMVMKGVAIPSITGYGSLAAMNVGRMTNEGWELNVTANKIIKVGKFSMDFGFNIAQNANVLKEMDESVLETMNTYYTNYGSGKTGSPWAISQVGNWPLRIQLNNAIGSIYGFRYLGVYQYTYDYLENLKKENGWSANEYEAQINQMLASGMTFPVALDANGRVLMNGDGTPKRVMYNYVTSNGAESYTTMFQGGDAIYEDINHDGQINELDVVYLGNSLPKVNGGFNFGFKYGPWALKARFMYRFGNKVVNLARQNLEKMSDAYNQCATVNYRWRKDGDVTPIPRARYGTTYNYQPSDRFVEDGGFVRFQNLQLSYNFDKKLIKKLGLNQLQLYGSMNNLYVWTKYSGVDPEVSPAQYGIAADASQTPRSKQFTLSLNVGF